MKATSKSLKLIVVLVLAALVFALTACGGSLEMTSFVVNRASVKTEYVIGEAIDFSGISATVKYNDAKYNVTYEFSDLTIEYPDDITATVGIKEVTVSFIDPNLDVRQETVVQIIVNEDPNAVKHQSYTIKTADVKTEYTVGEALDFTGIKLFEKMTDGTEKEISDASALKYYYKDVELTAENKASVTAAAGIQVITLTYNGEYIANPLVITVKDEAAPTKDPIVKTEVIGAYNAIYEKDAQVTKESFAGLAVKITYFSEEEVTIELEDLELSSVDTSVLGSKTITITFTDEKNNETSHAWFTVTIINQKLAVNSFTKPETITQYETYNSGAGSLVYKENEENGFSGVYANKKAIYTVGSYNAFKFQPVLVTLSGGLTTHTAYYAEVEVYIFDGENYAKLEEQKDPVSTNVNYYYESVLMVTVDTYRGSYSFTQAANDKQFKLSVLPSSDVFIVDEDVRAATLEIEVIDAYNAYNAKDLSVIDNCDDDIPESPTDYAHYSWDDFKLANGIPTDKDIKGIVLHDDIHISANDIPHEYLYTTEKAITYVNAAGETVEAPAGTRYMRDHSEIYKRMSDADFLIEGNFFTIDTVNFPLVASPGVFGADSGKDYGDDFSNTTLFLFASESDDITKSGTVDIKNINLVGNAGRNEFVQEGTEDLPSCGGLILLKSSNGANVAVSNARGNSYFISYFAEYGSTMTLNDVKCYDSFQNGGMLWEDSVMTVNRSYFVGSGGPVFIVQSNKTNDNVWHESTLIIDDVSVIETNLGGNETWFAAVNATETAGAIKSPSALLAGYGLGSYVKDDKMNIQGLLMAGGSDAAAIINELDAVGTINIGAAGLDRTNDSAYWNAIKADAVSLGAPVFTVYDTDGNAYSAIVTDATTYAMKFMKNADVVDISAVTDAFNNAESVTLTQGGITIVLEFYH